MNTQPNGTDPSPIFRAVKIRCPHDNVPMAFRERHGVTAHGCSWCRSLWLPTASWQRLCLLGGHALDPRGQHAVPPRLSKRSCPVCVGRQLVLEQVGKIEIDRCPECQGIWLDHGEIERLIGRPVTTLPQPKHRGSSAGQPAAAETGWLDVPGELLGSGIDLVGDVVEGLVSGIGDAF